MKFSLKLILVSLLVGACSGSGDAVQQALPDLPGQGGEIILEEPSGENITPKSVPQNVPTVPDQASYFGNHQVKMGDTKEFTLEDGGDHWVIDIEYRPSRSGEVNFTDATVYTVGDCSAGDRSLQWIEVGRDGTIFDQKGLGIFEAWTVKRSNRYILRITHKNMKACQGVYNKITIEYL